MDGDGGAAAGGAVDVYAAVVALDDVLDNGQAQATAGGGFTAVAGVHAIKAFKKAGLHVFGDAGAVVADGDEDFLLFFHDGDVHVSAGDVVLDGVVHQVAEHVRQEDGVAVNGRPCVDGGQVDTGFVGDRLEPVHDLVDDILQGDAGIAVQLALFNGGQAHDVVDEL